MNRRTTLLCCLLLTASLLISLPSLLHGLLAQDGQRMAARLRPAQAQPLVVWLLQDPTEGGSHLAKQISLFEKANPGARVFLRRAGAQELLAKDAILPDVVLFGPGAFTQPSQVLLPLALTMELPSAALLAGQSAMIQYALPLWCAPNVLSIPASLLPKDAVPTPMPNPSSFFNLGTPAPRLAEEPAKDAPSLPDSSLIPWKNFLIPETLSLPQGVALQQLQSMCPPQMQGALMGSEKGDARALSLAGYRKAALSQPLVAFPMTPAASENVLFIGLCKDNDLSRGFAAHLFSLEARAALPAVGLLSTLPLPASLASGDPLYAKLVTLYQDAPLFINAFEHTQAEILSLCLDGFTRRVNPVEVLLRLR